MRADGAGNPPCHVLENHNLPLQKENRRVFQDRVLREAGWEARLMRRRCPHLGSENASGKTRAPQAYWPPASVPNNWPDTYLKIDQREETAQ